MIDWIQGKDIEEKLYKNQIHVYEAAQQHLWRLLQVTAVVVLIGLYIII